MKKLILLLLLTILLTSCWEEKIVEKKEKQDFILETKTYSDFTNIATLEKSWKIASSQDITLTAQANGRVINVLVKEWDSVLEWQIIAKLSDSVANYGLALESASNNLEKSKLNYESTEVKLNKVISDIERDLRNSEIDNAWSSSSLELEKIENTVKKLALDYENVKISNQETIQGFKNSLNKDLSNFETYLEDIIDFSDDIFWITKNNKDKNDSFKDFLWVKDVKHLNKTKELLIELMDYKVNKLKSTNFNFEGSTQLNSNIRNIEEWYNKLDIYLEELDEVFDNSIISIWSLSSAQLSGYKSQVSGFSNLYNVNISGFVWLKNNINSFLETYQNSEESVLKQIELLEQDKKIYVKWLDYKIEVTNATLEDAKTNKELTLRNLSIIITDTEIAYKQISKQYAKLKIKSPISWIITNTFIDVWQEINIGTPAFSIVNNTENEVEISFNKDELNLVFEWTKVFVKFDGNSYTGSILSLSRTADNNLKYRSVVEIDEPVNLIGNIVMVKIPVILKNILLPINIIKIKDSWIWTLNILKETTSSWITELSIGQLEVNVWDIYSDKVEIISEVMVDEKLILNYVDNFDKDKFKLKEK